MLSQSLSTDFGQPSLRTDFPLFPYGENKGFKEIQQMLRLLFADLTVKIEYLLGPKQCLWGDGGGEKNKSFR